MTNAGARRVPSRIAARQAAVAGAAEPPERRPGHSLARRVLDRAVPVDAATRRAIDTAFRLGSSDPVLHAAALWVAWVTRSDLRLNRSLGRNWIPGLDELIHSGHLEAAAYALPTLKAKFPQLRYLENMDFVFHHLPTGVSEGRERFVDDRHKDVQTVRMPGADTAVIAFCGGRHELGMPINLLDRWFAQVDCHLVYLRDRQKIGYTGGIPELGDDVASTIESLAKLVGELGATRIVCLGHSAGASGALHYACALGVERVLALAPITGGLTYSKKFEPHLSAGGVMWWGDLVPLYRSGSGIRAHIVFGDKNAGDRQQSVRMDGLPGVTLEPLPGWESHHMMGELLRTGRLRQLLDWLVAGAGVADPDALLALPEVR